MTDSLFERGHALLVGVGRSVYEPWTLDITSRDAEQIKLALTDPRHCGYPSRNIRLLTDECATRANLLAGLEDLGRKVAEAPEATVIVYLSGHGWLDRNTGRYSLLLSDTTPDDFAGTALWSEDFTAALRGLDPARLLVVLDTCHAGGMAEAKAAPPVPGFIEKAPPEGLTELLAQGTGRVVLNSCHGSESSWILPDTAVSVFTHHFIAGLHGAGSEPESDRVTVLDVARYVAKSVPESARILDKIQTPQIKADCEDFLLAAKTPRAVRNRSEHESHPPGHGGSRAKEDREQTTYRRDEINAKDVKQLTTGPSHVHFGRWDPQ